MSRLAFVVMLALFALPATALGDDSKAAKIHRALSAAPGWLQAQAAVATFDTHGNATVLQSGTNGFTCVPGTPGVVGDDPMCMDSQGMLFVKSLMAHAPKPANTAPGVIYMLAGGSDYSVTNPWAMTGKMIYHDPPHWMIMWPFDPKKSGLRTRFSTSGTWVMWAGTPYAHLMIDQRP